MVAPIQEQHREAMNRLAKSLDTTLNPVLGEKHVGFVLLTAEFGHIDGGRVNYISNADRSDMLSMMKEFIARAEGRYVEAGGKA